MDFSRQTVLCFIEEDNVQRAYFRIRPLLTVNGPVSAEDIQKLPDEGYMRIVPDKNEQHTFKERMRSLGSLCVLDLSGIPPEVSKIRSNKNYLPQKGEVNQFIVYSDAVQPVPADLFCEIITAEADDKEKIAQAKTVMCYLRSGGNIFGPVNSRTAVAQDGAGKLAPDNRNIHAVTMPDNSEKLFYCGGKTEITEQTAQPHEEKPAVKENLDGMPLYQTVVKKPTGAPKAHNAFIDTVDRQLRKVQTVQPGAELSNGVTVHRVETPMEDFKHSLNSIWSVTEMQQKAVDYMLGMTGVRQILDQKLGGAEANAAAAALNSQIQDLEAERLSLIIQNEKAKKDMGELRKSALHDIRAEDAAMLEKLEAEIKAAKVEKNKAEEEQVELIEKRDRLLKEISDKDPGFVHIAPELGGSCDFNTLCERVMNRLQNAGFECSENLAVHVMSVMTACDDVVSLKTEAACDQTRAAKAVAGALGAVFAEEKPGKPAIVHAGGDSAAVYATTDFGSRPEGTLAVAVDCKKFSHPVILLKNNRSWKTTAAIPCPVLKKKAIKEMLENGAIAVPAEALSLFDKADDMLRGAGIALPAGYRAQIGNYLKYAGGKMKGGIATAMDMAMAAWVIPYAVSMKVPEAILRELTLNLPGSKEMALSLGRA